jgi:penicillin-binding protein 1C
MRLVPAETAADAPAKPEPGARPKERTRRVLDPGASHIVTDILADRLARSVSFGLDNPLAARYWAAVKTGTSKDMRDNWCIGFTSRYTVGVWVGNFDGSAMWDVSGVTGAAPLWLEIVNALHRSLPSSPPADIAGVVRVPVTFEAGLEPDREELFLPGTELTRVAPKAGPGAAAAILYPADGQIIAVDPDIPAAAQRVEFRAAGAGPGSHFRLNDAPLPGAPHWQPVPGRWRLSLHGPGGERLAEIEFEVRGSPIAQPPPPSETQP